MLSLNLILVTKLLSMSYIKFICYLCNTVVATFHRATFCSIYKRKVYKYIYNDDANGERFLTPLPQKVFNISSLGFNNISNKYFSME